MESPPPVLPSSAFPFRTLPKRIFASRHYIHFDEPVLQSEARRIVLDPQIVASWPFMPFIRLDLKARKVKKHPGGVLVPTPKVRPVHYASHKDAAIYSYYGYVLAAKYDQKVAEYGISQCAIAYRPSSGRSNIDFAKEVFDWISLCGDCVALAFDIKSFFDNLDHAILKKQWRAVLETVNLPDDHYAVFRSLTRYSFVIRDEVYAEFKISKHRPRANGRHRICSAGEFRERVRDKKLIGQNKETKGIPQGAPTSAVLSNMYMLDFDREVYAMVESVGGLYRRYSDDILCVIPREHAQNVETFVANAIDKAKLEIESSKTTRHEFVRTHGKLTVDKPLRYLGFVFDGQRVRLRTTGIARYYSRMRSGVSMAAQTRRKADRKSGQSTAIKRRQLYIRYSYFGRHNFISYALRAEAKMGQLSNNAIKHQIRAHWGSLLDEIAEYEP